VVSTEGHGVSFWANTGRIDVELADGTPQSFFIKVVSKELGKNMVHGEFESMKAIYTLLPDFAPRPIARGTYETIPDTHFFLCEYREMIDEMPDPHKFTARLAALHQNSKSPSGKFGFHKTTYSGNLPQMNEWEESWETYFAKSMSWALKLELKTKGPNPEFDVLVPALFDKVIPRLLRPLESEGRSVKPSLVHGDLWYANSGIDADTGESLIFDACCFYAHNECKSNDRPLGAQFNEAHSYALNEDEFGQWRPVCNRFGPEYLAAYNSYVQISPPEEDYDGRLDLYKL
jgi:protein-ribulosamine 3-kinase